MEQEEVTGFCYLTEQERKEMRERRQAGNIMLVLGLLGIIVFAIFYGPVMLLMLLYFLPFPALLFYNRRIGKEYDGNTTFELTETGIQTMSQSPNMCRNYSWSEVSVIQIARLATRYSLPTDYYVFVKGRENALPIRQKWETFVHIFSNPNRIAILKNVKTEPFVAAAAERYGIPREICYIPIRNKYD